jgi:hypothetical protein
VEAAELLYLNVCPAFVRDASRNPRSRCSNFHGSISGGWGAERTDRDRRDCERVAARVEKLDTASGCGYLRVQDCFPTSKAASRVSIVVEVEDIVKPDDPQDGP